MNICSFWAPRPEHPFFQDYAPFLHLLRLSCARFAHRHLVLTDDFSVGVDGDAYVTDLPRSLMKATLAAQYAYLSDPQFADTPTLLVGADCVLANDPSRFWQSIYADGIRMDPDIFITVDDRFQDCRMNCGAIHIPRPSVLAPVWKAALDQCGDEWGDDQTSVYAAIQASGVAVRELPCDPYNLAPDYPGDDCRRGVVLHFRGPRKRWMLDYCHKHLGLGDGVVVRALPNASEVEMLENVRINVARPAKSVEAVEPHRGHAVLVGGGPSLADTLPEIRRRADGGQTIFALNGTAKYLIEHGIWPDFGVILDPRVENAGFIDWRVSWLLASQCHPATFDATKGSLRTRMWHFATDGIGAVLERDAMLIGGGLTVGLTAMGLVFAMGYRKMHLYGYDSSDREDAAHAYAQDEDRAEQKRVEVWCGPRKFTAGIAMYAQAEAFPRWAATLVDQGALITVHGDGLLPAIARTMQNAATLEEEQAA